MNNRRTAPRQKKDELGRKLCRMPECGKLVGKGRRSYCSGECATAFEIAYFPAATRRHVFARDHGVCVLCRCDTEKLRRVVNYARFGAAYGRRSNIDYWGRGDWQGINDALKALGFGHIFGRGDLWQADHIRECVRGGWGTGLDNLRTLCTPCHKAETARLARELAAERKAQKQQLPPPLFQEVA